MKNNWEKLGLVFSGHHAQLPVSDVLEDRIRVYYSTRDDMGRSFPMFLETDKANPLKIVTGPTKIEIPFGEPGSFDWSGIMPTKVITNGKVKMLYYIGWSRRFDVPYHNTLGLAMSIDGGNTWEKFSTGPVLGTSYKEPGYIGTAEILVEDGVWNMWYLSCRKWIEHEKIMEPVYDIKHAFSKNGIEWTPSNKTQIPLIGTEGGISACTINKVGSTYEMLFSVRDQIGYREDKNRSYRIKKAISNNGLNWKRIEDVEIDISDSEWENFMVCYPNFAKTENDTFLFYNGNGFGKAGICVAKKLDA
jgi:hypothetical protein